MSQILSLRLIHAMHALTSTVYMYLLVIILRLFSQLNTVIKVFEIESFVIKIYIYLSCSCYQIHICHAFYISVFMLAIDLKFYGNSSEMFWKTSEGFSTLGFCSSLISPRSSVPPPETPSHMLVCIEVPPPIEIALDIGSFQG